MHFREAYDPFRSLGRAWDLLWKAPLVLLLGGLMVAWSWPIDSDTLGVSIKGRLDEASAETVAIGAAAGGFVCCFSIALFLFHALVRIGFSRAVERLLGGATPRFGELFEPRGLYGSMVGTLFLVVVIFLASLAPAAVVAAAAVAAQVTLENPYVTAGIAVALGPFAIAVFAYVMLGVWLAPDAVAFEQMRPTEAIARSWILVRGNRWCLFLYLLVLAVARFLGLILCCVGALVTIPWVTVAGRESYLRMVRGDSP
jgi:uncharacterized membrane protein (DUF485 family)